MRTIRMVKHSRWSWMVVPPRRIWLRESVPKYNVEWRTSVTNLNLAVSGTIKGLKVRLCAPIGVITKHPQLGVRIGPPQLSE